MPKAKRRRGKLEELPKTPTGVPGIDEVTGGGLPRGRPTLVCGSAGCGKTLLGMEFLVRGVTQYNEPGVFMSFEENEGELARNVASLGFDVPALVARKKLALDFVRVERSEIEETGEYNLDGLFVRLGHAIDSIGAKRVVLDTVEALFAALPNEGIVRAELRRLFVWLKSKRVTAIITGEKGEGTLTRHGLEEYVADCVILLDHRVVNQISTRRLRIVKYRGSLHGTNEYPFLIGKEGITVLPITSVGLTYPASTERISTGVPRLDRMLAGKGFYRGSSVLVSGTAGTGKSSLAATFAVATCRRGERCLYCAFEESQEQVIRNMRSIGIDLAPWVEKGLLKFIAVRPHYHGLEMHLVSLHASVEQFRPRTVIMDPITNLVSVGETAEVRSMLTRLIDLLKCSQITTFFTSLTSADSNPEQSDVGVSSLMDTWLLVRNLEYNGERNRVLFVLKSRGMAHSNQVREFRLSDAGIDLVDVYLGAGQVLTGTARTAQEAKDHAEALNAAQDAVRLQQGIQRKRQMADARIAAIRSNLEVEIEEARRRLREASERGKVLAGDRGEMARLRMADVPKTNNHKTARHSNQEPVRANL